MRKTIIVTTSLASFLTPFLGSSVNVALPSIGKEFLADAVILGWVAASYLLAAGIFSVPFGRFADIKGRKKTFIFGLATFFVGSILSTIANSAENLILFRFIQGIGGAMIFATAVAILTSYFPQTERGKVIGINTGVVYLGLSLGPILGGILTQYFGWRSIFALSSIVSILAIAVSSKMKAEWVEARGEKYDQLGSILYALTIALIIVGLSSLNFPIALIGLITLIFFVLYEIKQSQPVFELKIFKNQTFALSSLAALLNYVATFAVGFIVSIHLQIELGFDPKTAGTIMMVQPVLMVVFAPVAGWLSDRVEPRIVASIGMLTTTLALLILIDLKNYLLSLTLLGIGIGLFTSPNTNAIMSSVEKRFYGIASATVATMRLIGQLLSMAITISALSVFSFLEAVDLVLKVFAAMCFIGIFTSLSRGKLRK